MRHKALAKYEQHLTWLTLMLSLASTLAIISDWYPWTMFIGLPFCLIWVYYIAVSNVVLIIFSSFCFVAETCSKKSFTTSHTTLAVRFNSS